MVSWWKYQYQSPPRLSVLSIPPACGNTTPCAFMNVIRWGRAPPPSSPSTLDLVIRTPSQHEDLRFHAEEREEHERSSQWRTHNTVSSHSEERTSHSPFLGENFVAVPELQHCEDPVVLVEALSLMCVCGYGYLFLILVSKGGGRLAILFSIFSCWGNFNVNNVNTGPWSLSSLSEKVRGLTHYLGSGRGAIPESFHFVSYILFH